MMGEIVSLVFSEKASSWRHFINEYSRLAYTNPTEFRFRVYLLQLWIWSIYKEKSGVRKNSFYLGKENGMESIVQKLLNTDIHILNAHLEEILRGLNRNLNTSLALTNLLIKRRTPHWALLYYNPGGCAGTVSPLHRAGCIFSNGP